MKKKDRKLVKKTGEQKKPFRGFTSLKAAWGFLCGHPRLKGFPADNFSLYVEKDFYGRTLVMVKIYHVRGRAEDWFATVCHGRTFEKAMIALANEVLEERGDGKSEPLDPALRTIADLFSKL